MTLKTKSVFDLEKNEYTPPRAMCEVFNMSVERTNKAEMLGSLIDLTNH